MEVGGEEGEGGACTHPLAHPAAPQFASFNPTPSSVPLPLNPIASSLPGKEITKLLSSSNRVLKVSKGVASWKKYVDYFSDVIVDGLSTAIIATVRYLLNQLDPEVLARTEGAPLMEIQLELVASEIVWKPELTEGKVATR